MKFVTYFVFFAILLSSHISVAQYDSTGVTKYAVEIYNRRNGKKFLLHELRHVKIATRNKNGRLANKRAVLVEIGKDTAVFRPLKSKWKPVYICEECNNPAHIAFYTPASIARGIFVPTAFFGGMALLVSTTVGQVLLLTIAVIGPPILWIVDIASSRPQKTFRYPGNFRKHIDFYNTNYNYVEWGIRVIPFYNTK